MNATEETIFSQAFEKQDSAERSSYLDEACAGDAGLRKRVEQLLSAYGAGEFLESPAAGLAATVAIGDAPLEKPGTMIGPYKLLEQIGEGGMGVVYMAQQISPVKRKVALKIVKPGMDSRQVIARFEAERQAVAMMDHPNIARVFDAGTTGAARPYFVMELVRGISITDYCDREKLDTRRRLELLLDVCKAVQHAHQKAIIHRDLKPSNVLVTLHDGVPVVKVIDFGVAKALNQDLTERTLFTQFSQLIGTPLYMSPEQAELSGLDIDTRTDIYSLGVLLYELLTGTTPFDKATLNSAGFDELRRIIREDEPPRPSTRISTLQFASQSTIAQSRGSDPRKLSEMLRGELDWIVMKALEKDRNHRYESAFALAADIRRYLADEPVQACPPSVVYRFGKLARRHKTALTTVALIAAALIVGTAVSTWQAFRATYANKLATERLAEVERQRTQAQTNLIAANEARKLADDRLLDVERERKQAQRNFESALAGVERLLAQVEGTGQAGGLPLPEAARRRILEDAVKLHEQLLAEVGSSPDARLAAARTSGRVARLRQQLGDHESARDSHERTIEILSQLVANDSRHEYQDELAWAIHSAGWFYQNPLHNFVRAAELFRRSSEIYANLLTEELTETERTHFTLRYAHELNGLTANLGKNPGASDEVAQINEKVLELAQRAGSPLNAAKASALRIKANRLSKASLQEAELLCRQAVVLSREEATNSNNGSWPFSQHASYLEFAAAFIENRHPEEAKELYAEEISLLRRLAADYPGDTSFATRLVGSLERQARVLRRLAQVQISASDSPMAIEPVSESGGASFDAGNVHTEPGALAVNEPRSPLPDEHTSSSLLAEAESLMNEAASIKNQLADASAGNPNRHALIDYLANEARKLRRQTSDEKTQKNPENVANQQAESDRLFSQAIAAARERAAASSDLTHQETLLGLLREQALYLFQQIGNSASGEKSQQAAALMAEVAALFNEAIVSSRKLAAEKPSSSTKDILITTLVEQARGLRSRAMSADQEAAARLRTEADELCAEAIAMRRQLAAENVRDIAQREKLCGLLQENAQSLRTAGDTVAAAGQRENAETMTADALQLAAQLAAEMPHHDAYRAQLIRLLGEQAKRLREQAASEDAQQRTTVLAAADQSFNREIEAWRQRVAKDPRGRDHRDILARLLQAHAEHFRSLANQIGKEDQPQAAALRATGQSLFDEVISIRREIAADFPGVPLESRHLYQILRAQGQYLRSVARSQLATLKSAEVEQILHHSDEIFDEVIQIVRNLVAEYPKDANQRDKLIGILQEQSQHFRQVARPAKAGDLLAEAIKLQRQAVVDAPTEGPRDYLVQLLQEQAAQLTRQADKADADNPAGALSLRNEAVAALDESISLSKQNAAANPANPWYENRSCYLLFDKGELLRKLSSGEHPGAHRSELWRLADAVTSELLDKRRRLATDFPQITQLRVWQIDSLQGEANRLTAYSANATGRDRADAEARFAGIKSLLIEAVEVERRLAVEFPTLKNSSSSSPSHPETLARALQGCGEVLVWRADSHALRDDPEQVVAYRAEAQRLLREAKAGWLEMIRAFPANSRYTDQFGACLNNLSKLFRQSDRVAEAEELLDDALETITSWIKADPGRAALYTLRASTHRERLRNDSAWADYEKALGLEPSNIALKQTMTRFLRHNAADRRGLARALEIAKELAVQAPDGIDALRDLAQAQFEIGDFDAALTTAPKVLALAPGDASVLRVVARIQLTRGQKQEALATAEAAVAANTRDINAWDSRGTAHAALGNYEQAVSDYSKGLECFPAGWMYKRRAIVHLKLKHYEEALSDIAHSIQDRPSDLTNITWIPAEIFANCPDERYRNHFLDLVNQTVRLNHDSADALSARAGILRRLGQFDAALKDFDEVIERGTTSAYGRRAQLYVDMQQFDRALADFERAIELNPSDAIYLNNFSWLLVTCPDRNYWQPERAVELGRRATKLDAGKSTYWNTLATAEYRAGHWESAIEHMMIRVNLHDDNEYDQFVLAMAHWQLGHHDEARTWYDKAVVQMEKYRPNNDESCRFRAEATALLEGSKVTPSQPRPTPP
jgi:serine/threonine protein kinase/tetratricopeptide (TPR) repeat protein